MKLLALASIASLLVACGNNVPTGQNVGLNLERFIDNSVQGVARTELLKVIMDLPDYQRSNVIYIKHNGEILTAHQDMKESILRVNHVQGQLFRSLNGQDVLLPQPIDWTVTNVSAGNESELRSSAPKPYCNQDIKATGAWSRSVTLDGYNQVLADAYLPSKNKLSNYKSANPAVTIPEINFAPNSNETAYIYSGGWAGGTGSGLDAGFQYGKTNNDWAPFIRIENSAYIIGFSGDNPIQSGAQIGAYRRFQGGTDARLEFTVNDNRVTLFTRGWLTNAFWPWEAWVQNNLTVVVDLNSSLQWRGDGYGVQLKRMSSIGQTTFSASSGAYMFKSKWSNVQVKVGSGYGSPRSGQVVPWTNSESPTDGFRCYVPKIANPLLDHKVDILVSAVTGATTNNETVDIDLR